MTKDYQMDLVKKNEIPPNTWGLGFWTRPAVQQFIQQMKDLKENQAYKLTFPDKKTAISAHQNMTHRLERARKLGFLQESFTITGRANVNGDYNLYLFKGEKKMFSYSSHKKA